MELGSSKVRNRTAYRRHYHATKQTYRILERLPGWMAMRDNPESVGFQFINSIAGLEAERLEELMRDALANQFAKSADPNEPYRLYATVHDSTRGPIPDPDIIVGSGLLSNNEIGAITPTRMYRIGYGDNLGIDDSDNFDIGNGTLPDIDWFSGPVGAITIVTNQAKRTASGLPAYGLANYSPPTDRKWSIESEISLGTSNKESGIFAGEGYDEPGAITGYVFNLVSTTNGISRLKFYRRTGYLSYTELYFKDIGPYSLSTSHKLKMEVLVNKAGNPQFTLYHAPPGEDFSAILKYTDTSSSKYTDFDDIGIDSKSAFASGDIITWEYFILRSIIKDEWDFQPFIDADVQALLYVKDYAPSGVVVANEAFVIGLDKNTSQTDLVYVLGISGNILNVLDVWNYGRIKQSYDTVGFDDLIAFNDGSGSLNNIPINGTLGIYDILNLDSNNNATTIAASSYSIDFDTGDIAWFYPSQFRSQYIAEYDYQQYQQGRYMTTRFPYWHNQKWGDEPPVFSSIAASGYVGTIIGAEDAYTPFNDGRLLAVDCQELRPSGVATIDATYTVLSSGVWDDPENNDLTITISDPYFKSTTSQALKVNSRDFQEPITKDRYYVEASGNVVVASVSGASNWETLDYLLYYQAEITDISVTGVASISTEVSGNNPYPDDWILVNQIDPNSHSRQQFIHPKTILPITHIDTGVNLGLQTTPVNQFTIRTTLDYRGIAYDRDSDIVWLLEQNNAKLYAYDASNSELIGKSNILKPNKQNSLIRSNVEVSGFVYPFIPQDVPENHDFTGMVYLNDFLYVLDKGTNQVHRVNVFDHFNMDVEYTETGSQVYKAFPFPSGVSDVRDCSIDKNNNLVVATPSGAQIWNFAYDYYIVDNQQGRIFYREKYDSIDVELPNQFIDPNRGDR